MSVSSTSSAANQSSSLPVQETTDTNVQSTGAGSTKGQGGWMEPVPVMSSNVSYGPIATGAQPISVSALMSEEENQSHYYSYSDQDSYSSSSSSSQSDLTAPFYDTDAQMSVDMSVGEENVCIVPLSSGEGLTSEMSPQMAGILSGTDPVPVGDAHKQAVAAQQRSIELEQSLSGLSGDALAEATKEAIAARVAADNTEKQLKDSVKRELAVTAAAIDPSTAPQSEGLQSIDPMMSVMPDETGTLEAPVCETPELAAVSSTEDPYLTDGQLDVAAAELKTRYAQLQIDGVIDYGRASLQLQREVERPAGVHAALIDDPVTNGFVQASGVDISQYQLDPQARRIQDKLAHEEPMLAVLLEASGVRIETSHFQTTTVTVNGANVPLTDQQKQLIAGQNYNAFALTLLADLGNSQRLQFDPKLSALLGAMPEARLDFTQTRVQELVGANRDRDAVKVLSVNMNAAMSPQERATIWQEAGLAHFNEAYFDRQIDSALNMPVSRSGLDPEDAGIRADNVGRWTQDFIKDAEPPSEMANIMLDRLKGRFDRSWYQSLDAGEDLLSFTPSPYRGRRRPGTEPPPVFNPVEAYGVNYRFLNSTDEKGEAFAKGLVQLVDITDQSGGQRADEVSRWLLNSPADDPVHALGRKLSHEMTPIGGRQLWLRGTPVFMEMRGSVLAEKILTQQLSQMTGRHHAYFEKRLEESAKAHQEKLVSEYVLASYNNLLADPDAAIRPYLSNFIQGPDITRAAQYEATSLRNYIGRAMGMTPTNGAAADAGDNSREWYADPGQRRTIAVVEAWITEEGGNRPTLSAIPMVYADARQGVMNITLFKVQTPDGPKLIDSSIANIALNGPDGESFKPGDKPEIPLLYDDFQSYIEENRLSDKGTLYTPRITRGATGESFTLRSPADGQLQYQSMRAAIETTGEKITYYTDIGVAVVGTVAGVGLAFFSGGQSLWITAAGWAAVGSMGYGAYRTGDQLHDMYSHGQSMSFANPEARMQYLSMVSLAAGGGGAWLGGMSRTARLTGQAFKTEAALLTNGQRVAATGVTAAETVAARNLIAAGEQSLARATTLQRNAYGLSGIDIAASGTVMAEEGYSLLKNWELMTPAERAQAAAMFGINAAGFGVGMYTIRRDYSADPHIAEAAASGKLREAKMGTDRGPDGTVPAGEDRPSGIADPEGTRESGEFEIISIVPEGTDPGESGVFRIITPEAPRFTAEHLNVKISEAESGVPVNEETFWPNPAGEQKVRRLFPRLANWGGELIYQNFPSLKLYNSDTYAKMWSEANGPIKLYLPAPDQIAVDRNTMERSFVPEGLDQVANDIHYHPYPYDRRAELGFIGRGSTLVNTPQFIQILSGSIPEHCGGAPHYSSFSPTPLTLKNSRLLDNRAADLFLDLYKANPRQAARLRISITGVGDPDVGFSPDYIRQRLLEYPGVYEALGELTLHKEMVSTMRGDEARTPKDDGYQEVIRVAQETGLALVLHSDWSKSGLDQQGRLAATKSAYEPQFFDELGHAHSAEDLRKLNIIFAHTGIGRSVRPNETPVKKNVDVIQWDFRNGREISRRTVELEAPEHIHKMYEMIAQVPNARFDISWTDVSQAYMDSPAMREAMVDFIIANPDRIVFGTDAVKPANIAHYTSTLKLVEPLIADVALRDPVAAWKLTRTNFEDVLENSRQGVLRWTDRQFSQEMTSRLQKIDEQYSARLREIETQYGDGDPEAKRAAVNAVLEEKQAAMNAVSKDKNIKANLDKVEEMYERDARLHQQRQEMNRHATGFYNIWLGKLQETWEARSGHKLAFNLQDAFKAGVTADQLNASQLALFGTRRSQDPDMPAEGVGTRIYRALPPAEDQHWHTDSHTGHGTPGGTVNEANHPIRENALLTAGLFAGNLAWFGKSLGGAFADGAYPVKGTDGVVLPEGVRLANDASFGIRGISSALKALYGEKLRLDWETIFEEGHVTRDNLDRFVSRIVAAQEAHGFSKEQMLRVGALTEQFYKNYSYLRDVNRPWSKEERFKQIMATVGEYQIALDREISGQASTLSAFDPRRTTGQLQRAVNLGTLLINDAAAMAWLSSNGVDFSSPDAAVRSLAPMLFLIGNGAATLHTATGLTAGRFGLNVETGAPMRWLQNSASSAIAAGGVAWTAGDAINAAEAFGAGQYDMGTLYLVKAILAGTFTAGTLKMIQNDVNALLHNPVKRPEALAKPIIMVGGALALYETIEIMQELSVAEEREETGEGEDGSVTPLSVDASAGARPPLYPAAAASGDPGAVQPLSLQPRAAAPAVRAEGPGRDNAELTGKYRAVTVTPDMDIWEVLIREGYMLKLHEVDALNSHIPDLNALRTGDVIYLPVQ